MRVRIGNSSVGGRVNIKSRLPVGYQEVEYLESPNAEYIDTGKTANSTSIIAFDFQYVSFNSSYNRIFGARNGEGKGLLNIRTSTDSGPYLLVENVNNWVSTTSIGTNKHSIKMNGVNHNLYYDGSTVASNFSILDSTLGNMWLFGTNQGGTNSNVRIFNYTHIKGGTLIQKLVPCVRLSDNKPGMYDIVNDNFLVNSGTGEFVVGPNVPKSVLPDEYQRVEYVEGTGTQYIDTGIKFIKRPYKMDFKFYRNDNSGKDMSIFGQRTLGKFVNTYSTYYETAFGTTTAGTLLLNQDVHMIIDSLSGIYQNGTKILNNYDNSDRSSDYSAFMFAFHENVEKTPSWFLKGRIYYYTIWEAGVVTHNFLPCYRKSDGEIGMYDVITKQFFTNQGTGTFLKGSNVVNNIICKPHITIEGTTNLFPSQYQNGYYISGDSSSTLTSSGQFSVSYTIQGKYTLSGYYKIASTDSAVSPRITLRADYSDGTTAVLKQDWDIKKDDAWHRFIITGEINANKTLTRLYGWIFDYSTPGSARNFACKCVQLENKDHATLYTPTSRPDNTII